MTLSDKIQHSIEVLRKGEELALQYDQKGYLLAFSGGKDSQCLYHIAKMADVKFEPFFSPTTVDPPEVIRFIKKKYPDVVFIHPKKSIYEVAKERGVLPTMTRRWCCAEFKEIHGSNRVVLLGIRREESQKRSKRKEVEVFNKKYSENFDQFSEHKEKMMACVKGKDKIMVSPILEWTEKDVWNFLNDNNIEHCELYDRGYKRIGCILCPMSTMKEKMRSLEEHPRVARKWAETIEWLQQNKWNANPRIEKLSVEQRMRWWFTGESFGEFMSDYLHPKLFSDIEKDKLDLLIDKALRYEEQD